ncbi:MAG: chromosome partitioning protein ParB, partial [Synergistota bacterium]|nr:chromosome partitioning protein ParB [Synergistota bacterium]
SILEDTKWSQTELAARLGLSQSAVSNKLRLLKLEAPVQTLVMQGKLGERQARALIGLSREEQVSMALVAVEEELPANELERRVKEGRIISAKERRTVEPSVPKTSRGSPAVAGGPTGEILKDIAELVERNRRKGIQVAWSVKELAQRELILELIVDLKSASEEPRE